ncbi:helix-turn-helix transcriptional regulator [Dokdonella sp.]|uniref:helix-turn-helix domain-containing protein n=1 Tax=Dokdonella sp. TaxID=2291710 RepID=UPI002DD64BF5|nr:helix-turn-helix transcriptional regulator [Dokdonella sp.]
MKSSNKKITTFESHLVERYGQIGSEKRTEFEAKAKAYVIGELLKEERLEANLTQEELAEKIGAKKSYISRVENGKTDVQLSTLYRLFEYGLGKRISIVIE